MNEVFFKRIHRQLDKIGMPMGRMKRAQAFATLFGLKRQMSFAILSGNLRPSKELLEKIAQKLEIDANWLIGRDDLN